MENQITLSSSIRMLSGVGESLEKKFSRIGISTVRDLLFHFPVRYQDRTKLVPIGSVKPGDEAVICGEILLTEIKFGRRRMLLTRLGDGTGYITLRFFHFSSTQKDRLMKGEWIQCFGEVRQGINTLELIHPEYQYIKNERNVNLENVMTPIYPGAEGISQPMLRKLIDQALARLTALSDIKNGIYGGLCEILPDELLKKHELQEFGKALSLLHRPPVENINNKYIFEGIKQRLAFEELLAYHLKSRQLREDTKEYCAPVLSTTGELYSRFLRELPFLLTTAQKRVVEDIIQDVTKGHPMKRLLQGDVGSGKTVIAIIAVLFAVEAGGQAAIMAPTELLCVQHYDQMKRWLAPFNLGIECLSGKMRGQEKKDIADRISSGATNIVVGTHSLFQKDIEFNDLALIVIDEQHRFGVYQRMALWEKGAINNNHPHQLIMTATPIPRTLAMTAYADLDISVIDEMPPGRKPIDTIVISDRKRDEIWQRVRKKCKQGQQVFWICPLIEESEVLQCQAAQETTDYLKGCMPDIRIGLLHGRMASQEREQVMSAFKQGDFDLLVATTVIEVGIDVPSASLIIIENSERLGLAQLHQLRGRVGRGSEKSICVLMYKNPLTDKARRRLCALRETNDGFELARKDLEIRGPGEVFGLKQSGELKFKIADLVRDQEIIPDVNSSATLLLGSYNDRIKPIVDRWLGETSKYSQI